MKKQRPFEHLLRVGDAFRARRRKYELVFDDTVTENGQTLYRIRALRNLAGVRKGDLGGYVASEKNLSQNGECWIFGNARVYDRARVSGNAMVGGSAVVHHNGHVSGMASISESAKVGGKATVEEYALVGGDARIGGSAVVEDHSRVGGNARIGGNSRVRGEVNETPLSQNSSKKICDE